MASEGLPSRSTSLVERAIRQLADLNDHTGDQKLDIFISQQYQTLLHMKDVHFGVQQFSLTIGKPRPRSLLDALPKDVILSVTEYLGPVSALCFALCNRDLYQSGGEKCCRTLRDGEDADRREFLALLARDVPYLYLCEQRGCSKLHHYKTVTWPNGTQLLQWRHEEKKVAKESLYLQAPVDVASILAHVQPQHWLALMRVESDCDKSYSLDFLQIHFLMKRHRFGSIYGIPLRGFAQTSRNSKSEGVRKFRALFSVEPRIINNELLLRAQSWRLVPVIKCDDSKLPGYNFDLCGHDDNKNSESDAHIKLKQQLACKYTHIKSSSKDCLSSCAVCGVVSKCDICNMEFVLDARIYEDERKSHLTAIFLTRYYNLGSCQTPDDPRWRSHLPVSAFKHPKAREIMYSNDRVRHANDLQWQAHYPKPFVDPSPAGTIQNTFEKPRGGRSLKEFTMANERKILAGMKPEDSKYISYI